MKLTVRTLKKLIREMVDEAMRAKPKWVLGKDDSADKLDLSMIQGDLDSLETLDALPQLKTKWSTDLGQDSEDSEEDKLAKQTAADDAEYEEWKNVSPGEKYKIRNAYAEDQYSREKSHGLDVSKLLGKQKTGRN